MAESTTQARSARNRFDRIEWAGAFGDLGTLILFAAALHHVAGRRSLWSAVRIRCRQDHHRPLLSHAFPRAAHEGNRGDLDHTGCADACAYPKYGLRGRAYHRPHLAGAGVYGHDPTHRQLCQPPHCAGSYPGTGTLVYVGWRRDDGKRVGNQHTWPGRHIVTAHQPAYTRHAAVRCLRGSASESCSVTGTRNGQDRGAPALRGRSPI